MAEKELDEWVSHLPSYIQDTTDFLRKLETISSDLPSDVLLFTMDVKKLYPSIPIDEGLEACQEALNSRNNQDIPTDAVMKMLKTVLNNNIFQFNNKNYIQIEGTAIGSKLGKNFACTYMGKWEEELMKKTMKTPLLYIRFVDDIFGIWNGTEEELIAFQALANSIHPRIEVELKSSRHNIDFLDVNVWLQNGKLQTSVYEKPTDRHMYLHKSSNHPQSTKNAIPYGLGIRAKRICSTSESYEENRKKIVDNLVKRGHNKVKTHNILKKVDIMPRSQLLIYKQRSKNNSRVPLVITYGSNLPDVQKIVHKRMSILYRSDRMKKVFKEAPIVAFRRDANLEDILVHAKHRKMFSTMPEGTSTCGKNCVICKHMSDKLSHVSTTGKQFVFKDKINCKTSNVVYGIHCKVCDKIIYVGETGTTIYERFQNHLSSVRRKKEDPISQHFSTDSHSLDSIKIVGVEKIKRRDIHMRKIRESFWIEKLQTINPHGLNQNGGIGDGTRGLGSSI